MSNQKKMKNIPHKIPNKIHHNQNMVKFIAKLSSRLTTQETTNLTENISALKILTICDILLTISSFVDNKSGVRWLMITKISTATIKKIKINFPVYYREIEKSEHKQNFTNIMISSNRMNVDIHWATTIEFDRYFDVELNHFVWPQNVKHIIFGQYFDQKIKNIMPFGIRTIKFDCYFNQSIVNTIPPTVTTLIFGDHFNYPIENNLPNKLKCLVLGGSYNRPIINTLPRTLRYLRLSCRYNGMGLEKMYPRCTIRYE